MIILNFIAIFIAGRRRNSFNCTLIGLFARYFSHKRYQWFNSGSLIQLSSTSITAWLSCHCAKKGGGCERMVVGFTTSCAISVYWHKSCELESLSWRGVLDTTLCDNVCQWLAICRWFSSCTPVCSTNKKDCYDISDILLKVALKTITLTLMAGVFVSDILSL